MRKKRKVSAVDFDAELYTKAKQGDQNSLVDIFNKYKPYIYKVCSRYKNLGVDVEDLEQEAFQGVCHAVKQFNPKRNVKFFTYLQLWINKKILKYVKEHGRNVRIPLYIWENISKIKSVIKDGEDLENINNYKEISEKTGFSSSKIKNIISSIQKESHLNIVDACGQEIINHLEAPQSNEDFSEEIEYLMEAINTCLDKRERTIILNRFGIHTDRPKTLEQVGRGINLTLERVRQIQNEALNKLKIHLRKSKILC